MPKHRFLLPVAWCALASTPLAVFASTEDRLETWDCLQPTVAYWERRGAQAKVEGEAALWSMLVAPDATRDQEVTFDFAVRRPSQWTGKSDHKSFRDYHCGAENSGYDLGVVLRWRAGDDGYRIQLSTRWQEMVLWKPSGGVVSVSECSLGVGSKHSLSAAAAGNCVVARLDGKEVLRYVDPHGGDGQGRPGLASYGAAVSFSRVSVGANPRVGQSSAQETDVGFRARMWHGQKWLFADNEPIALLDKQALTLWDVKLLPGFRPVLYWELFWKQYDGKHNYSDQLDRLDLLEQGPRLRLAWRSQNPAKEFTTTAEMTVGLDDALGTYSYDVATTMTVNPGRTWTDTADGLEYCNLIPYNVVGPATYGQPNQWPWWYRWVVYQDPDSRLRKHPLSHNRLRYVNPKQDGGCYGFFGDNEVDPVVLFGNPADEWLKPYAGICHWAHDIHFRYRPYKHGYAMPSGTVHRARYRVVGFRRAKSKEIVAKSEMHPYFAEDERYPIYVSGVNRFNRSRGRGDPQREYEWKGGEWDRDIGRGDRFSIRLTGGEKGKSRCQVGLGESQFSEPIRFGVYKITAYVRAKDVEGEAPRIGVQLLHPTREPIWRSAGRKGTYGWRRIVFTPYLPKAAAVNLLLDMPGKGTAWFDDVEVVWPRKDGACVYEAEHMPVREGSFEAIKDTAATGGSALVSRGDKPHVGSALFGPYSTAEPEGRYTAYFRLKAAENTSASGLIELDVHESYGAGRIAVRGVRVNEFRQPNVYQYVALPFRASGHGALQYRGRWLGGPRCWIDHVAVVPSAGLWDEDFGSHELALDQAQWLESGYCAVERVGQTFVPTMDLLARVDIQAKNRTCTLPGTFRLWQWRGDHASTVAADPLFEDMLDLSGPDVPQLRRWLPRLQVVPGKTYYFETEKKGQYAGIIYRDGDAQAYPDGMMFVNGVPKLDKDVAFVTFGRGSGAAAYTADVPKVTTASRWPAKPAEPINKAAYLNLLKTHIGAHAEGWLRADGKHAHRHAFHFAFLYKVTRDEAWAERAAARFRDSAKWRRDHPGMHIGFYWLPHACMAYRWIRESNRVSAQDHETIQSLLVDAGKKHWAVKERGAMNRSMGSALGYSLLAKLYPAHADAEQWKAYAQLVWNDWFENRDTSEDSLHYHAVWWEFVLVYIAENGLDSVYHDPGVRKLIERYRDQVSPLGPLPPYGDCYGWGFEWGGYVMLFEAAAAAYHDGTYKRAAHRVFDYLVRHIKNTDAHLATYEDMPRLALAYLYADDDVPEAPLPRRSKVLTRKQLVLLPVPERKRRRQWFEVRAADVPDKLVLRSQPGANDMFAVFNLTPTAGHGHFDATALVCLTSDDTALITDTCYGDRRPDDHSQLVVQRLRGGRLATSPPAAAKVTRFAEARDHTFCEVECGDYAGWGAKRTRQILFVKNVLIWVRDKVEFGQAMEASAGPLWFAGELAAEHGPNWFDAQWNEPRGFRWRWRNGDRRLLICFVPQPEAHIGRRFQRWKVQREPWEWSPPWCVFQKRPRLAANKGTHIHFNTLLIPHSPDASPSELAASVQVIEKRADLTTLKVRAHGQAWRLSIGAEGPAVARR